LLREQILALKAPNLKEKVQELKSQVLLLSEKKAKGLGKGGPKRDRNVLKVQQLHQRHRQVLRGNIQGITKQSIRRLARRGGVRRISDLIYRQTRDVLQHFLDIVIHDALVYSEHGRRFYITAKDVVYALKRQGITLYGFGA
jgi:histone H4